MVNEMHKTLLTFALILFSSLSVYAEPQDDAVAINSKAQNATATTLNLDFDIEVTDVIMSLEDNGETLILDSKEESNVRTSEKVVATLENNS